MFGRSGSLRFGGVSMDAELSARVGANASTLPKAVAYAGSVGLHLTVLLALGFLYTEPPRLTSDHVIEVTLVGADMRQLPTPRRTPPAKPRVAIASRSETSTPTQPASSTPEPERDSGEKTTAEARYDVAALNNPKPPYPLAARRQGIEGRVMLLAQVRTDGSCGEVTIQQSSGHAVLDRAALDTVRQWRFIPARRGGQVVEAPVQVPIVFRLGG
jgi:TonB family protein